MGNARPCMGYPSRTKAVLALAGQGLSSQEIARLISADAPADPISVAQVSRLKWEAHARGEAVSITLRLGGERYEQLARAAAARGSRSDHLARRLIEAALADGLIDAILDDGGEA